MPFGERLSHPTLFYIPQCSRRQQSTNDCIAILSSSRAISQSRGQRSPKLHINTRRVVTNACIFTPPSTTTESSDYGGGGEPPPPRFSSLEQAQPLGKEKSRKQKPCNNKKKLPYATPTAPSTPSFRLATAGPPAVTNSREFTTRHYKQTAQPKPRLEKLVKQSCQLSVGTSIVHKTRPAHTADGSPIGSAKQQSKQRFPFWKGRGIFFLPTSSRLWNSTGKHSGQFYL